MIKVSRKLVYNEGFSKIYDIFANNIKIAKMKKSVEWYRPVSSRVRYLTKQRYEYQLIWDTDGLNKLFNKQFSDNEFSNHYHLTSGYNLSQIQEWLEERFKVIKEQE